VNRKAAWHSLTAIDWTMILAVTCYAVLGLTPFVTVKPPLLGTLTASLLFAAVTLGLVAAAAQIAMQLWEELCAAAGFGLCWQLMLQVGRQGPVERAIAGPAAAVLFVLTCVFVGRFAARMIREPNLLLPVCVVAAIADVYTVFWGPTGKVLEVAPQVVEKLAVSIPKMGSASGPHGVAGLSFVAMMGLGDVIFAALFFAAAVRFELNVKRTFWGMLIAVIAGMAVVLLYPPVQMMPLLPFIVVGFLAANYPAFSFTAQERRSLLIAGILIGVVAAVLILVSRL